MGPELPPSNRPPQRSGHRLPGALPDLDQSTTDMDDTPLFENAFAGDDFPRHPTMMDAILPPQVVPLLAIFLFIAPFAVLTAESLFVPVFERINAFVTEGTFSFSFFFTLKIVCFVVLCFLGMYQLLLRLNVTYMATWSRMFPRPHALHVDYQPHSLHSMKALLSWHAFRMLKVLGPPAAMGAVVFVLILIELYFFNAFGAITQFSLPLQFIVGMFLFLVSCLFFAFSCFNSLWTVFTSVFGSVTAVTEPDLPAKTVQERSARIAFLSPLSYFLYPAYGLFTVGLIIELTLFIGLFDIEHLLTFPPNPAILLVFLFEILTVGLYLLLSYFRFYTYHHAMALFYHRLPRQMKEEFTPPPAAY